MEHDFAVHNPIRIFSDLHLGHDVCTVARSEELRPLIEGAGTVIFNGDTLEAKAPHFRAKSEELTAELQEVCAASGTQALFLNGNHDPDSWPLDWLDLADGAVFLTHGHALLRLISPWSVKLRHCRPALEAIWRRYDAAGIDTLESRLEATRQCCAEMSIHESRQRSRSVWAKAGLLLREVWPPTRPWNILKTWAVLPGIASEFVRKFRPRARVFLFGHTHRAACWEREGRLLVNTGGFVSFAKPWMAEVRTEVLALHEIEQKGGAFHRGRMIREVRWENSPAQTRG